MQMLTRDELYIHSSGWVWNRTHSVRFRSVGGDELYVGTHMVRSLIGSRHTVTIGINNAWRSEIEPLSLDSMIPGRGSGSIISLNTRGNVSVIVDDWGGRTSRYEYAPTHIVLGHELVHAYRFSGGNRVFEWFETIHSYISPSGVRSHATSPLEELQTIGISHTHPNGHWVRMANNGVTENALRREQGLSRRIRW